MKKENMFSLISLIQCIALWGILALGTGALMFLLEEQSQSSFQISAYLVAIFTSPIAIAGIIISIISFFIDKKPIVAFPIVSVILNTGYLYVTYLGLKCIGGIGV